MGIGTILGALLEEGQGRAEMGQQQGQWKVTRAGGASIPGSAEDKNDLFVYLVDVETGWMMAGSFEANCMEEARMQAMRENWTEGVFVPLSNMVRQGATNGLVDTHPLVREAIGLAMAAATITPTFKRVLEERGGCDGHWLILVYTTRAGVSKANVSFGDTSRRDFLGQADMSMLLQESLRAHLDEGSEFGALLASHGGALIAHRLAELL
jgi:hypothetical protein